MSKREIALWIAVGMLALWLLLLTLMVAGELAAINAALTGAAPGTATPTPPQGEAYAEWTVGPQVGIAGVRFLSDTLVMTVTVRSTGTGDLLYEPPVLVDGARTYPVTGESLEHARFAFLDLVTRGQATAELAFAGVPEATRLTLVFNPGQDTNDLLAPRVEVLVPAVATPTPGE